MRGYGKSTLTTGHMVVRLWSSTERMTGLFTARYSVLQIVLWNHC